MLIGKKDSMDAEEFWRLKEEELGTKVLAKTLGRVIQENSTIPLWGLFYTTENAIYFQTFHSENWISTLFSGGKGGRTQDATIEIVKDSVKVFTVRERKGGLFNLLRQPPLVELTWKSAENGEDDTLLFEMDGSARAFVETFPL